MKKYVIMFIFTLVCFPLFTQSMNLELGIQQSVERISDAYAQRYPNLTVKRGAVILDFIEESPAARSRKLGTLIRVHLEEAFSKSLIFYMVDRRNLASVMDEMTLSLSGLVDEDTTPQLGLLRGSHALVYGTIVEDGSDFRVSVSITDIEQGDLLTTYSFTVPNREMVDAAVFLQYQYVAQHGIGLSTGNYSFITADEAFNKYLLSFVSIDAKYRLSRNFMISVGIKLPRFQSGEFYRYDESWDSSHTPVNWSDFQRDLPPELDSEIDQLTNQFIGGRIFHITGQYTLNFSPKFNLGLRLGAIFASDFRTQYLHSAIEGLLSQTTTYPDEETLITRNNMGLDLHFEPFNGGKVELSPEFFITPRLAINATFGYILTQSGKVEYAYASQGDWIYPET